MSAVADILPKAERLQMAHCAVNCTFREGQLARGARIVVASTSGLELERSTALMAALDACNARFGPGTIVPAAAGVVDGRSWATRFEMSVDDRAQRRDAPGLDLHWLAMVHDAVGRSCPWRIHDLALVRRGIVAQMDLNPRTAFATLDLEEAKELRPHRAGPDAIRMARLTQSMIAG
jgi:hypothetical protein